MTSQGGTTTIAQQRETNDIQKIPTVFQMLRTQSNTRLFILLMIKILNKNAVILCPHQSNIFCLNLLHHISSNVTTVLCFYKQNMRSKGQTQGMAVHDGTELWCNTSYKTLQFCRHSCPAPSKQLLYSISSGFNYYFHCQSVCRLFSQCSQISKCQKMWEDFDQCFPKTKILSSNICFSLQPKDIQFTIREEERTWKIITFKQLETENFDFIYCFYYILLYIT